MAFALIGLAAFAVVAGAGVALGGPTVAAVLGGLILGLVALFLPLTWLMWAMVGITFVLVGAAQYFGGLGKSFWMPYLLGLLLLIRLPMERYRTAGRSRIPAGAKLPFDAAVFVVFVVLYFAIAAGSTLLNLSPWIQVFVGVKEYAYLWSICFLLAAGLATPKFEHRIWLVLLALAPLQLPVVLYQRFVVATSRVGTSAWDAVVGLFGGDPEGGGASGAMAFFLLFCALLALSLWRAKRLPLWQMLVVWLAAVSCVAMAEVKAVILLLPLAVALLLRKDLLRRPLLALASMVIALGLSVSLIFAYQSQFTDDRLAAGRSLQAYVELMYERATDTDAFEARRGQMNRPTSFLYWSQNNPVSDPVHFFLGHGIGATKIGNVAMGEVARYHPYRLNTTGATQLLWEIGVLGLLAVIGFLVSGMAMASKASHDLRLDGYQRAVAAALFPMLFVMLLTLAYNTDLVGTPPAQLLLMLMFGYLYRLRRASATQAPALRPTSRGG